MDTSDENMSFQNEPSSGIESEAEFSIHTDVPKPASTDELKDMLKEAGTELTIKYITGEITVQEFTQRLQKKRPKESESSEISEPSTSKPTSSFWANMKTNIPQFDLLMEEDDNEEIESDDGDDDEEDIDPGDNIKDGEWQPSKQELKMLKKSTNKDGTEGPPVKKKPRKPRRLKSEIPKYLASQHGQAMLLRAQGKIEESMALLFDIIEKAPLASVPFKTLGSIHEEKGNMEQALKFYMVSANMRKSDINEWFDLSSMWIDLKDEKMALMCLFKAFKFASKEADKLEVLNHRIMFYEKFGHPQKTIAQTKDLMIPFMRQSDPDKVLEFARSVVKEFMEMKEINCAISCMLNYFKELPNLIDSEDVHLLVELLMSQKSYQKCVEMMIKLCGVECETALEKLTSSNVENVFTENTQETHFITKMIVPSVMPIDLKCKLLQCLLLGKFVSSLEVLQELLTDISAADVEEYGDIHYDICETLLECGHAENARHLLHALVESESFNKAAVWLSYGQCLNSLGDIGEAAKAFENVLEMAPGHYEARVTLSSLQQQMGHHDRALELLSKDPAREEGASTDQLLLLRKCQLLFSQDKMEAFIKAAQQLMSFNFRGQFKPDFVKAILNSRSIKHRVKLFPEVFQQNKQTDAAESTPSVSEQGSDIHKSEQLKFKMQVWDIYLKLYKEMYHQNRLDELMEASILGISCPTFYFGPDDSRSLDAEFLCLKICILTKNERFLNNLSKTVILKSIERNQSWNLYCYIGSTFKNTVDLRFPMRGLMKNPNSIALRMLNGATRLICGSYKQALGEYLSVFRLEPHNDLALLCCGLCLAHLMSHHFIEKRNLLLAQVVCLLNAYKSARGECQETYYNLGRAMQQLKLFFVAVHYYKKALQYPPIIPDDKGCFDLTYEIAYNLALIYEQNGNEEYARYYIEQYCVI